jgi:hypothetical protein
MSTNLSIHEAMKYLKLDGKNDLTADGVRMHIKKLQLKYHPDKMNGDRATFEYIHAAGVVVLKSLSKQSGNHFELKASYNQQSDEPTIKLSKTELAQNEQIVQQAWDELVKKKDTELLRRKGYSDKQDVDFTSANSANSGKQLIVRIEPDPIWFGIDDLNFEELNGDSQIKKPVCQLNSCGVDYHDAYNIDNQIDKIKPTRAETSWKDKSKYEQQRDHVIKYDLTPDEIKKSKQFASELEQIETLRIEAQRKKDIHNRKIYEQINFMITNK